jgi:type IV pilus assembly protein PilQ
MRQTGNVIMVAPTQEIAALERLELETQRAISELEPLRRAFIKAIHAKANDLAALLSSPELGALSERGSIVVDERTNTLVVRDTASRLEDIRRMVDRLDVAAL